MSTYPPPPNYQEATGNTGYPPAGPQDPGYPPTGPAYPPAGPGYPPTGAPGQAYPPPSGNCRNTEGKTMRTDILLVYLMCKLLHAFNKVLCLESFC